jgi:hypothetical protein
MSDGAIGFEESGVFVACGEAIYVAAGNRRVAIRGLYAVARGLGAACGRPIEEPSRWTSRRRFTEAEGCLAIGLIWTRLRFTRDWVPPARAFAARNDIIQIAQTLESPP